MDSTTSNGELRRLMAEFRQGDRQAANQLVEIFYPELRRLANALMRKEREGHSWQPTLLVNELYLELIKIKALPPPEEDVRDEKSTFFGLAAHLMRRLLIHHSRPLKARVIEEDLSDSVPGGGMQSLVEIDVALSRLERIRPRLRSVVELKVFEGMTLDEVAASLNCSTATVTREWYFARHWLEKELPLVGV